MPDAMMVIDFRSDTVTRPTQAMRKAMVEADVGDDVFREDPSVARLEETVADLLGKQAALFVPSGTMANQLALLCQTHRGDEIVVAEGSHCATYEGGAASALSGVQAVQIGRNGLFTPDELRGAIRPNTDWHARTALAVIENTHNHGGGRAWPMAQLREVIDVARDHGLATHLDGARLWNAAIAVGTSEREIADPFDTVTVCFSKGLGAPVGSALCSSTTIVTRARKLRKMLGGGMRQAGIIASGALYALMNHRTRLQEDHDNAKKVANIVAETAGNAVRIGPVETNIVLIDTPDILAKDVEDAARHAGVLVSVFGKNRIRVVLHMDVAQEAESGATSLGTCIAMLASK